MTKAIHKTLSKLGLHLESTAKDIDLVCGMEVSQKSEFTISYKGRAYYFCSVNCLQHFQNDPGKYVGD